MEILADPQNIDESQYRGWTGANNSSSPDRTGALHLLQNEGVLAAMRKKRKEISFPLTQIYWKASRRSGRVTVVTVALTALVLYIYYKMKGY
jgi:hypothetical protein